MHLPASAGAPQRLGEREVNAAGRHGAGVLTGAAVLPAHPQQVSRYSAPGAPAPPRPELLARRQVPRIGESCRPSGFEPPGRHFPPSHTSGEPSPLRRAARRSHVQSLGCGVRGAPRSRAATRRPFRPRIEQCASHWARTSLPREPRRSGSPSGMQRPAAKRRLGGSKPPSRRAAPNSPIVSPRSERRPGGGLPERSSANPAVHGQAAMQLP